MNMVVDTDGEKLPLSQTDAALLSGASSPKPRSGRISKTRLVLFTCIAAVFFFLGPSIKQDNKPSSHHQSGKDYQWYEITPSETLQWKKCYGNFLCARLTVPMDYHRPLSASSDNPKVDLSLFMVPGASYWKHGNFSKSPLVINPGGPGVSGTAAAFTYGAYIQNVVGEDQAIVGFDPRGVGFTKPAADCFSFSSEEPDFSGRTYGEETPGWMRRLQHTLVSNGFGLVNSSNAALAQWDAHTRAFNKLCEQNNKAAGNSSILQHLGTPSVARDMLSIVDAWDAWQNSTRNDTKSEETEESAARYVTGCEGKLVYWGFSYGTLLGATFSAMFPDKVCKVVLDGVVDGDQYVAPVWESSIEHTDSILSSFAYYCQSAGKKCAFYREGQSEWDLEDRFFKVVEDLRKQAIYGADKINHIPVVVDYPYIKLMLFATLYRPMTAFPIVAEIFNLIEQGKWEDLIRLLQPRAAVNYYSDASIAIRCSDKRYPLNDTLAILEARFQNISRISSFADVWMTAMIGCDGWAVPSLDPPIPWDDHPLHRPAPIKTFFPIMFVSNTRDPVTPLAAGIRMARKFVGAGLLVQDSEGHCSLSSYSACTVVSIRRYFRHGRVPPLPPPPPESASHDDTTACVPNEWPWQPYEGNVSAAAVQAAAETVRDLTAEERAFLEQQPRWWDLMQQLARDWPWWGMPVAMRPVRHSVELPRPLYLLRE